MTKGYMNTQSQQTNKELFESLMNRETSVTLSDLQRYVASAPAPTTPYVRYMVVGVIVMSIATGIFYFSDNAPSRIQTMTSEIALPQSTSPAKSFSIAPSPEKQIVTPSISSATATAQASNYQLVPKPKRALTTDGLREKPATSDPMMGLSEQSVMASNDPSTYVMIATIELPESSTQYQ